MTNAAIPRRLQCGVDSSYTLRMLTIRRCAFFLLCAVASAQCAAAERLTVGSKRFTESYVLGEILRQTAAAAGGAEVAYKPGLGNTGIVFEALKTGAIDVYPEYTGTIAREILKNDANMELGAINRALAPLGLAAGVPLGFNNSYALAMRAQQAAALGITRVSDLARHPELKFGLSQEFMARADGWAGLRQRYGLSAPDVRGLDHGLAFEALAAARIDVVDVYSTDAKIAALGLTVLEDDLAYFPKYDAVLLYRGDLPQRFPQAWARLQGLAGALPASRMIALNAAAELQHRDFADVAHEFVEGGSGKPASAQASTAAGAGAARTSLWRALFAPDFSRLALQHLGLVFGSVLLAVCLGVPLGILAARVPRLAQPVLAATGVLQTIPSLALLAFLIPVMGEIGTAPALAALFLYALLPIVRNTHTGLTEVATGLRQAGLALGLRSFACLRYIELPMASRMILAGVKTSAIINVGTATIAAFIGAGGFGERIAAGLALNDHVMLLAGAIPAAALALMVQGGFELAERTLTPNAPQRRS
jgi:osmoprotectant transport system substrate-binding protein/osmoprotectant transport system permease protein